MKSILKVAGVLVILTGLSCGTYINPVYNKLPEEEKVELYPDNYKLAKRKKKPFVYVVNATELLSIIKKKASRFSLIVLYATWCSPCRKNIPQILSYMDKKPEIAVFFVSSSDWIEINNIREYWKSKNFYGTTYILDIYNDRYKNRLMIGEKKRAERMLNELCPDCGEEIGGYPTYLLFNNEYRIVLKETGGNIINKIDSILSKE